MPATRMNTPKISMQVPTRRIQWLAAASKADRSILITPVRHDCEFRASVSSSPRSSLPGAHDPLPGVEELTGSFSPVFHQHVDVLGPSIELRFPIDFLIKLGRHFHVWNEIGFIRRLVVRLRHADRFLPLQKLQQLGCESTPLVY